MRIVPMTQMHVSQIAELEKLCFSDPWSERSIASELSNPLSLWLVAVEDERLAGYVGSQTVLGETDMMNVAVHPEYRRKGIARELICNLIEELKADKEKTKAGITGVEIAARIIRECKPYCQGVHIMALGWESKIPEVLKLAGI